MILDGCIRTATEPVQDDLGAHGYAVGLCRLPTKFAPTRVERVNEWTANLLSAAPDEGKRALSGFVRRGYGFAFGQRPRQQPIYKP